MMKSRFSRDESIQCISEITVPVLSVFGEHDSVGSVDLLWHCLCLRGNP